MQRLIDQRQLGGLDGAHVYVRGRASVEQHWTPDVRRDVFSVSKTLVSLAIGIAQAEGLLRLDDPVVRHLEQSARGAADGVEAITIEQLLTMTSGLVFRWDGDAIGDVEDPADAMLHAPLGFEPGTGFAYRGGSSYLLSRIVHSCSGQDLLDFLQTRVFTPLSIHNVSWERCPLGFSMGAVGLALTTEELSRIGRLLLDGGRHGDRQLVPSGYVDALISRPVTTEGHRSTNAPGPHPDSARYGRHVWLCSRDSAWRMDGIYGQFGVVFPRQQACITVTAHYRGPTTDILDAMWSEVVPAIG